MPEQVLSNDKQPAEKPFPWRCPKCRQTAVNRVTMPYRCQRTHNGRAVTVEVPDLAVPRCSNCGEVVFDYAADEQIRTAFLAQFGSVETRNEIAMSTTIPAPRRNRQCREYERFWRGHCVDRNLDDGWLEALNALDAFNLISICEGHVTERPNSPRARPHINLRLKPSLLPRAVQHWHVVSPVLKGSLAELFVAQGTSATVELKLQVRNSPTVRDDLTARFEARRTRVSAAMDTETADWFRCVVESIKCLDRLLLSQLNTGSEGATGTA